jgi:hypothetical protein
LAAFANRASAGDPAAGSIPSWRGDDDVAAFDRDLRAVRSEPLEGPGTGERPVCPPANGGLGAADDLVDHLELEVRERLEQLREVLADAVRRDQLLLADQVIDRPGLPACKCGVEIMGPERVEITPGDAGRGARHSAAVYAAAIWCAG